MLIAAVVEDAVNDDQFEWSREVTISQISTSETHHR